MKLQFDEEMKFALINYLNVNIYLIENKLIKFIEHV